MATNPTSAHDGRSEPRDVVMHRTRALLADGGVVPVVLVNVSPHGFMARCDADIAVGERLRLSLPHAGGLVATVRWALGGRVGCELDHAVAPALYRSLLAALA